jgi:predicted ATPase
MVSNCAISAKSLIAWQSGSDGIANMTETRKLLHFANIRLQNWKNFASCDVAIGKRVFLVGPNASGKSNFLDLFRFLRDLASSGGGFQEAVGRRRGVSAIRCLAARKYPDIEIQVVVVGAEGSPRWRYELGYQPGQTAPRSN